MTREKAWLMVSQYKAIVRVSGQEYADKHYLAKGTSRFESNTKLLRQAQNIVDRGPKKS